MMAEEQATCTDCDCDADDHSAAYGCQNTCDHCGRSCQCSGFEHEGWHTPNGPFACIDCRRLRPPADSPAEAVGGPA